MQKNRIIIKNLGSILKKGLQKSDKNVYNQTVSAAAELPFLENKLSQFFGALTALFYFLIQNNSTNIVVTGTFTFIDNLRA